MSPAPLVVGILAGLAVLGLRYAGIVVGPVAVVLVVLSVALAPGPKRISERLIILFALGFGWLPLLGWIPNLGTVVDVPGFVLAIGVGIVAAHQVRLRRARMSAVVRPNLPEIVALAAGVAVAVWWALPYARLGLSGRLQYLFRGWDNNTHFAIFRSDLRLGSFILVHHPLPGGAARLGWDYPQGMHEAWAQLVRLWSPHAPGNTAWVLNAYAAVLIATTGIVVVLGCMAVCRLCRRDVAAALPGMAVIVTLYGFGAFGPFSGFPNFDLAIAAAAVGVTLMVRPTLSPNHNFFAVAGMGLVVVYNWYPLVLLVAPAVVLSAVRARRASVGRHRTVLTLAIAATAVVSVMPALFFLHRGVSTLNEAGGGVAPSWGLFILGVAALIALAVYRQTTRPDRETNGVLAAPAILGLGAVVLLAGYEVASTGAVAYYGQKFAAGVLTVCLVVLACVVAAHLSTSGIRRRLSPKVAAALAVVVTLAALQFEGYVGPFSHDLQASDVATGLAARQALTAAPRTSFDAGRLLAAARIADRHDAGLSSLKAGHWWYVDPAPIGFFSPATNYALYGEWFADLRGDPTDAEYFKIGFGLGPRLDLVQNASVAADVVLKHFRGADLSHVHVFAPGWLAQAISRADPSWRRPGLLWALPG